MHVCKHGNLNKSCALCLLSLAEEGQSELEAAEMAGVIVVLEQVSQETPEEHGRVAGEGRAQKHWNKDKT